MASIAIGYAAGASQDLQINFAFPNYAGGGSLTIRVVTTLTLSEVSY
jgi:hypothetical protein